MKVENFFSSNLKKKKKKWNDWYRDSNVSKFGKNLLPHFEEIIHMNIDMPQNMVKNCWNI